MIIKELINFLEDEFSISEFKDYSQNGLQVGKEDLEITKIAFAVDACLETFQRAKESGCNVIITHHGLFWNDNPLLTNNMYKRVKYLMNHNISLIALHLPLDAHKIYGNNAQLCNLFDAKISEKFDVGFKAELNTETNFNSFLEKVNTQLKIKSQFFNFGNNEIRKIAVVSGGAANSVYSLPADIDVYITGEPKHEIYHFCKEMKLSVIFAGHYATETVGIIALQKLINDKFQLSTEFIDIPTGL